MKELIEKENRDDERTQTEEEYDRNFWITEAMILYGGSFVKRLGKLYRIGDGFNQKILQNAFPEYWKRYDKLAAQAETQSEDGK